MQIHSISNLSMDQKYDLEIRVPGQKMAMNRNPIDYVDNSVKGQRAPFHLKKPILLPIYGLLEDTILTVDVYKSFLAFRKVKIGTFRVSFNKA
jgi:hypothetical protein